MKILVINNANKPGTVVMAEQLREWFVAHKIEVQVQNASNLKVDRDKRDLVIVLGGDGTILKVAREWSAPKTPILGVNMGTVGFLCNIKGNQLKNCLEDIVNKNYKLEERMLLNISIYDGDNIIRQWNCLNEVVVKSNSASMINLEMDIDSEALAPYRGDGIIIATPTGSTAYSLSAGGAAVDPALDAIILTPLASYWLNQRPVVIHSGRTINIKLHSDQEALICIDGQVNINIKANNKIKVQKADDKLCLATLHQQPFFSLLDRCMAPE